MERLVGDRIRDLLADAVRPDPRADSHRLPNRLRLDVPVRTGVLRRLAASAHFALGDRSGVLRTAQRRSGRAFRLDVRQRVIVKALVSRHARGRGLKGQALLKHVAYLGRIGAGVEGGRPAFFDRDRDGLDAGEVVHGWTADRHHFRFIISPEHGDRIEDLPGYVREVVRRVGDDLGQPGLTWIATIHYDTDQPHAHVLVRGRRGDGRDLVIPRDYIGYGFRARAQEVAQERLGDLSRHAAERRIWRETEADRFTGFDRRLIAERTGDGSVADGTGPGPWAALLRGRLRRLEALGLARRVGGRYHIPDDLEHRLRTLQVRSDVIRTLNQRRLESEASVQPLTTGRVRGAVVKSGHHDELGAQPYVIVRDSAGVEHYARLAAGTTLERVGHDIVLQAGERGVQILRAAGAAQDLGLP